MGPRKLLNSQLAGLGLSPDVPPTAEQWQQLVATIERTYETSAKSVATYDAVLEAAIDGMLVTDARGRVVRYSRRFAELFAMTDLTMAGDPAERLHVVAQTFVDPEGFVARTRQIIEGRPVSSCDELSLHDGRIIERISSPIVLDHEVIGRVWLYRDITLRKQNESALRYMSEDRHQFLFEASPLPIWVFDPKSLQLLAVNEAMVTTLGYARDELLAMTLTELKPEADIPSLREQMATIGPRVVRRVGVKAYRRKDGGMTELDITSHSVFMGGRLVQLAIGIDVTETRRLEERLHQAQKLDAIGQLAGGVAHDFNNILAAILSNAECARELLDPASAPAMMLEEIETASERGASLTRQLLAFSRKQRRHVTAIDLNAVVGNIERLLTRVIGEHIEMTFRLDDKLGTVHADTSQLEQVVLNLIINARDAMPAGGRLIVETANTELDDHTAPPLGLAPGDHVVLSVTDTGVGMDAETRARIFEPFFTTKEVGRGTGLGLATVFGIIEQSEGAVSVYSELGRGSTFRVYLPRTNAVVAAPRTKSGPITMKPGDGRILLVEDDDLLRGSLERRLRSWGYAVLTARDPIEAIELARCEDQPIQLMLTDLVMPQMDGRTLANRILPARPATRVLFMSGSRNMRRSRRCRSMIASTSSPSRSPASSSPPPCVARSDPEPRRALARPLRHPPRRPLSPRGGHG